METEKEKISLSKTLIDFMKKEMVLKGYEVTALFFIGIIIGVIIK